MAYTTYFLKFSSKEEAEVKLDEVGWKFTNPEDNQDYYRVVNCVGDIDIVGEIYNNDVVFGTNDEGIPVVVSEPTKKDGYHVNIILDRELPESLLQFKVDPTNPYRVFA